MTHVQRVYLQPPKGERVECSDHAAAIAEARWRSRLVRGEWRVVVETCRVAR